ncbi:MAG: cell division protein FtsL [Planctomycetota bacterium]|nr:MAG: cell division protein FtsL [Planctomycetota bacterium]
MHRKSAGANGAHAGRGASGMTRNKANRSTIRLGPWIVLLLVGAMAALQVGLARQRLMVAGERAEAERQARALRAELGKLRLEWATLTRPERVRRLAVSKLGMRPPAPAQVVRP